MDDSKSRSQPSEASNDKVVNSETGIAPATTPEQSRPSNRHHGAGSLHTDDQGSKLQPLEAFNMKAADLETGIYAATIPDVTQPSDKHHETGRLQVDDQIPEYHPPEALNDKGVDLEAGIDPVITPNQAQPSDKHHEADHRPNAEILSIDYNRFTRRRKTLIMSTLCYCGFLTPIASTAILVAIPEVALTLSTTGVIVNISNALFFLSMALSPIFWGPLAQTSVGRRKVLIISSVLLTAFSAGTAAAPDLGSYIAFRMLTAFQGTAFLVVGSVVIGDIFHPEERGRALGVFMSGILVGPTVAPLLGGIVITFTSWRVIFWIIAGLSGVSAVGIFCFVPETMPQDPGTFEGLTTWQSSVQILKLANPWTVVQPLLSYPNLWIAALAVSSLVWNQYSLLTPIRYVINPRFGLTTPIQSALFFLPPGAGYLIGVYFGGRWSDIIVARYLKKRGRRISEDRLNAVVVPMAIVIPEFMIIYGWAVEKKVGGIPLVVISMFFQGFTQQFALPSLNTYLIDVFQDKGESSVAVAGNYLSRFMFAAAASAVCLPAIRAIGIGWFSTISGLFISVCSGLVWLLTRYGEKWRQK